MQATRLLTVFSLAAMLSACSASGTPTLMPSAQPESQNAANEFTTLSAFTAQNTATGEIVRIFPTHETLDAYAASRAMSLQSVANLQYHSGPVQTSPKLYLVLWGNWTLHDPYGVRARLQSFYSVIGGKKWLNSVTQYKQSNGLHVGNAGSIFVKTVTDTTTPPLIPTQTQLAAEAAKVALQINDHTVNASYVIALPHGVRPSGFGTQYCAWHSAAATAKGTIAYTNLPYMPDAGSACGEYAVNSTTRIDGVTIVGGHEQAETETDPQPNSGWLDSADEENGDKCAWIKLINNPYAGGYPTQPLWSNTTSGGSCVQSY